MKNIIKNEEKTARVISSALITYYFAKTVQNFHIYIDFKDNTMCIRAEGKVQLESKDIEELHALRDPHRLPEFENYYEELIGIGYNSNEISNLDALSSIVDKAKWTYEEEVLCIQFERRI